MHWTAMLAYRRVPRDARIGDDLTCVGCGYNLRGMLASGRCPECGADVGKSLYVLAKPAHVASGLRTVAWSYLTVPVFSATCLLGFAAWLPIIVFLIVLAGAITRATGAWYLRRCSALEALPGVGNRTTMLFAAALIECGLMFVLPAAMYIMARPAFIPTPATTNLFLAAIVLAITLLFASLGVAGSMGLGLARVVGHRWIEIEFKAQLAVVACCAALAAVLGMLSVLIANPTAFMAAAIGVASGMAIAPCATAIPLMHLANAVEQEESELELIVE